MLLAAGTFQLSGSLTLATSGVVLRGSGSGAGGTVLNVTGSPRMVLSIAGTGSWSKGTATTVTDPYVPSGAVTLHVASASGLKVGSPVLVERPVTQAWVDFMGMNDMVRNGMTQTWIEDGNRVPVTVIDLGPNTVTAIKTTVTRRPIHSRNPGSSSSR